MSANNPVKTNKPLDWLTTLNLSEEVKDLLIEIYKNNDGQHAKGYITILIDPTGNPMKAIGAANPLSTAVTDPASLYQARVGASVDYGAASITSLFTSSIQFVLNPALPALQVVRTPSTFNVALFTIGNSNVAAWTPTAGKKFRCMGALITVSDNIAEGALDVAGIYMKDGGVGGAAFAIMTAFIPAATLATTAGAIVFPISFQANGYLSTAINAVLQVGLYSAANLTAGAISASTWGTEE